MPVLANDRACVLLHLIPSLLLPVRKDLRGRDGPDYRDFFDRLVADVRQRGVQQPLLVCREGDRYRVIDGETRRLAALLAGVESVPVLAHETEPAGAELLVAQVQANLLRCDMTELEKASVYQRLMTEHGWKQTEVAERLHISQGTVAKALAISKGLAPELQERVAAGTLAPRVAYALTKLKDHARQLEMANLAAEKALKCDAVEARVKQLLGRKERKEKPLTIRVGKSLQAMLSAADFETLLADVATLAEGIRRCQKQGLPLAVLPSVLKGS